MLLTALAGEALGSPAVDELKSHGLGHHARKLATICLTIAVLLGSAGGSWSADFLKGLAAAESGDFATALREWTPLAKQGDADAQFNLGLMYSTGQGVPQDDKTAVKWFTLAAKQGGASAQGNLGAMYAFGKGVLKDYVYAHMWGNIAATRVRTH